jgi:hypothetical protein
MRAPLQTGRTADLDEVIRAQHGAVSRPQLLEHGVTDRHVDRHLRARRWKRWHQGVYLTFTGPVPYTTRVWAALLYAGEGATASHETAAWLAGIHDEPPTLVHLTVPSSRRVCGQAGLRIYLSAHLDATRHPARLPAQTRVEDTILDLVPLMDRADGVVDLLTRACQRRLTTAERLAAAAARRKKLRWRALVVAVLVEVEEGVQSPLELRYLRDVERAHRLPKGVRNRPEGARGRRRYRDVRYRRYRVVVELDGKSAHPGDEAARDQLRDADVAAEDVMTLRFGWAAVTGSPCDIAASLARLFRSRGWRGDPRPCGPHCPVSDTLDRDREDFRTK